MNRLLKTSSTFLLMVAFVGFNHLAAGQSMGPLSGAEPKSFNLSPDNAGFLENSVNLFNGQVQFPFPLMSLSGRGTSLSYNATLFYNSANVKEIATTRNQEAPAGPFGLGWSLDRPRIIADHKGTGSRDDDDFYLQEGGASHELVPSGSDGSLWVYKTKQYQPWKITYDPTTEEWVIRRETGMTYRYGNTGSGRNTVQNMIRWGNWIGHSALLGGQVEMAYIWDLSEIEDTWGDKLLFTYELEEEQVSNGTTPANSTKHTKASYLKEVANLAGRKLVFTLQNKNSQEYTDPHTETVEPDPYQEKFEAKYVSKLGLYSEQDVLLKEIELGYGSMGTGNLYKRLLTTVTQKDGQGVALPGADYTFEYITNAGLYYNTGAMSVVHTPFSGTLDLCSVCDPISTGGTRFTYSNVELSNTDLSYVLPAYNSYKEPRIFMGVDYAIVTRRNVPGGTHSDTNQSVIVDVLTWDGGKWNTQRVTPMVGVDMITASDGVKEQNFQLVAGKDFFATLNKPSTLSSYNLHIYKRDPNGFANWIASSYTFTDNASTGLGVSPRLMAGEDFVLIGGIEGRHIKYEWIGSVWDESSANKPSGVYYYGAANNFFISHNVSDTDSVRLYYKTRAGTWKYGRFSNVVVDVNPSEGPSYWHLSNSFALLMAAGKHEYLYKWDANYADTPDGGVINTAAYATNYSGVDADPVIWTNNSTVAITQNTGGTGGKIFRYTGFEFVSTDIPYYNDTYDERLHYSFSDDNALHSTSSTLVGRKYYNPITTSWVTAPADTIDLNSYINPRNIIAGADYMAIGHKIYFRNTDGSYTTDPVVLPSQLLLFKFPLYQAGFDFLVSAMPGTPGSVYQFKNGKVFNSSQLPSGFISDGAGSLVHRPNAQAGFNTIVTYTDTNIFPIVDQSSVTIYRKLDQQFTGKIKKWVATNMNRTVVNISSHNTYFQYNATTATIDPSGSVPQFNEIKTYPDNDPLASGGAYKAHTANYFFNGLPASQVGNNFPDLGGNTVANYKKLNGIPYRTQIYYTGPGLLSESVQDYKVDDVSPYEYNVRAHASSSTTDGITTGTTYTYNAAGQLATQTTTNMAETIVTSNTYWWEAYDPTRTTGFLTPVISQTSSVNGEVVAASATKWKYWGTGDTKPAPYESYSWNKTGSSNFTDWGALPPNGDWLLENEILSYDLTRGLPIETRERDGMMSYSIYDPNRPLVLASCSGYSSSSTIRYEGFESTGNSTTALAGTKSNDGAYAISGVTGSPKLTYWRKIGTGNWEYVETTASNTSIGAAGTLLDEVRIFPAGSYMTTSSYDDFGNVLSSNDVNNILSHYEYDSFGRLKLVRDQKKNILKSHTYHFQN